jgi:FkbM family methyltransferase
VFDVGANAGQYALLLRHLGYKKAIISFEPIPDTARKLRKLAAKDKQWFVEEIALEDAQQLRHRSVC